MAARVRPQATTPLVRRRIKREKTKKIFIDSRDVVTHENNNPASYTYRLAETIPDAIKVKLLSYRMPYSPTFVVTRTSKWMDSSVGDDVDQMDSIHAKADDLATISAGVDVEKSSRRVSLYKTDGTVSLNVVEVFTFRRTRDSDGAVRSYDVYVCTGTVASNGRTDWRVQDPTSDWETVDYPMSGSSSDDATGGYAASDAGSSSIAVALIEENVYLKLGVGQAFGRLSSVRSVYPTWKSFQVYRKGDHVCYGTTCYTCATNHLSLIFDLDLTAGRWNVAPDTDLMASGAAQDAYYVVETNEDNEVVLLVTPQGDEISHVIAPTTLSTIDIEWLTRRGSHFIFPHTTSIDFKSFTDTDNIADLKKEYLHHTLQFEITYLEESDVLVLPDAEAPPPVISASAPAGSQAALAASSSPLMLPTREY